MKKILFLLPLLISVNSYAQGPKTQLKLGIESTNGTVSEGGIDNFNNFNLTSFTFHVEIPLRNELGVGLGFRKEELYGYDGYYLDLYARYKLEVPKSRSYLHTKSYLHMSGGISYGIPSKEYDRFDGNNWLFLKQDSSFSGQKIFAVNPFVSLSLEIPVYKRFSLEPGITLNFMEFGFKRREPFFEKNSTRTITTFRMRFVYSF